MRLKHVMPIGGKVRALIAVAVVGLSERRMHLGQLPEESIS